MAKPIPTTKAPKAAANPNPNPDTGSAAAQVSRFTERIQSLSEHLKRHQKDHSSRRGLLKLVGLRRRQLDYLKKKDFTKYQAVVKKLGLRK